jgi:murein DD-endopeptidase MepM/ murein hydrolase activator NlpD
LDISIAYTHERLGERLRAIAKTGNMSAIQRLLNTDNYEEYLLKSKAAECIAKQDQALMDKLEAAQEEVRELKAKLEVQKQEIYDKKKALEVDKAASDAKKKELDTLCAAVQSEIKKLQSSVSGYNDELKAVQKKIEEADAAIEKLIKETQSVGKYDQDMMYWPVPAVRNISSYFGPRWGTQHRGIDISNGPVPIYGQNIYAAADGVVIAVNYTSSYGTGWSYGYGYCVLVDHGLDSKGRKVTTMYAHASKMFARVGDVVKGGETVLAQAGRTGNVTGPHLHFEVRLDGVRVNPYPNYVHPDVNIPKGK